MKIKVISDGSNIGTMVVNAETGEKIENVQYVVWSCAAPYSPKAIIHVLFPEADVIADATPCAASLKPDGRISE